MNKIDLEHASKLLNDGVAGIDKVTADWKAIGLLSPDSTIKESLVVDPSVPIEETIIDVKYSCGATARIHLNMLDKATLHPAIRKSLQ